MDQFEYEVTRYSADKFSKLVVFCSEDGDCGLEEVPTQEPQALVEILNGRGELGWELLQLTFGRDGVMAFWKRKLG